MLNSAIAELSDVEIDGVAGGPLWLVPLFIAGVKAGLASSAGTTAAVTIGAAVGVGAATAALAAE